jgi:hypothetical protein
MTCHHELHDPHYRAVTATGDLAAFLHRHNRLLILGGVLGGAGVAALLLIFAL